MGSSPFWPEKTRYFMLKNNKKDIFMWLVILFFTFFSFFSFYYFSKYLLITRIALSFSCISFSFFLFTKTNLGYFVWISIKESLKEINYITWPSNKDTIQTTLVISGIVIIMGIMLCLIDVIFFNLIKWVANFG